MSQPASHPSCLPINQVMDDFLAAYQTCAQVIVKAEPGAGKSTLLPLKLMQAMSSTRSGKIIMMEPRRLAAKNIAYYLAHQLGEKVGQSVGYRIRGEAKSSASTKLEIVTEGIMTRMIQADPELNGIDGVIFDEFHERSIHADTALAFCLESQQVLREDLKLVVMSATLEQEALCQLLPDASYIESHGRSYPVTCHYAPLMANQNLTSALVKQIELQLMQQSGSILVFLPGVKEIRRLEQELLVAAFVDSDVQVCPLYGQLDLTAQQQALAPCGKGKRKVVLATNIAETSLTIDGITVVIDSGLERVAKFDARTGITRLEQSMIAQSSAQQRAGRAGRLSAGVCVRMYSQDKLAQQAKVPSAEILRSDLAGLKMELVQWGAQDASQLSWLDLPPASLLEQADQLLQQLGLLNEQGQVTAIGQQAQRLGLEPRFAAMLLRAQLLPEPLLPGLGESASQYLSTALALIPLLEQPDRQELDLALSLSLYQLGRYRQQKSHVKRSLQLASYVEGNFVLDNIELDAVGICLAMAFPDRIAQLRTQKNGQYLLANGHGAFISTQHKLASQDWIVAVDLVRQAASNSSQIFRAAALDIERLQQTLPHLFVQQDWVEWDDKQGTVVAEKRTQLGKIVLTRQLGLQPDKAQVQLALLDYIRRQGLAVLPWNEVSENLLTRIRNGIIWLPDEAWPDMSADTLLAQLEHWLAPYMLDITRVSQFKQIDLQQALLARLGWPLSQQLDEWLPIDYLLPTGSHKKIRYQEHAEPVLSVPMQEMFGQSDSPLIAKGNKRLVLELLSPAQRPLQITQDLAGFWQGSYQQVQKEMKGRYPKHIWPDDPANHVATNKTKRHFNS